MEHPHGSHRRQATRNRQPSQFQRVQQVSGGNEAGRDLTNAKEESIEAELVDSATAGNAEVVS